MRRRGWQKNGDKDLVARYVAVAVYAAIGYAHTWAPARQQSASPTFAQLRRWQLNVPPFHVHVHITLAYYGYPLIVAAILLALGRGFARSMGHIIGAGALTSMCLVVAIGYRWSGVVPISAMFIYGGLAAWAWQGAYRSSFITDGVTDVKQPEQ